MTFKMKHFLKLKFILSHTDVLLSQTSFNSGVSLHAAL